MWIGFCFSLTAGSTFFSSRLRMPKDRFLYSIPSERGFVVLAPEDNRLPSGEQYWHKLKIMKSAGDSLT